MFIARFIKYNTPLYKKISGKIKALDNFFLMRPILFFPVWIMTLAGISAANGFVVEELWWSTNIDWLGVMFFLGLTLITSTMFIQWQILHRDRDRINQNNLLICQKIISEEKARSVAKLTFITGMVIVVLSLFIASIIRNESIFFTLVWVFLLYGVWGILFYQGKFLWSMKPILETIGNGLAGLFLFMVGWTYAGGELMTGLIQSIPYVSAFIAVSILTSIPDRVGDEQTNKVTFAIKYGDGTTLAIGTLLICLSTVLGYKFTDPVISTASIITLPFFLVALILRKPRHVLWSIRYPILILGIFVGVRYPWFFVPLIINFYLMRHYYYFRFGVIYPSFSEMPSQPLSHD